MGSPKLCQWCAFKARAIQDLKRHESFFHYEAWSARAAIRQETVQAILHVQRHQHHAAAGKSRKLNALVCILAIIVGYWLIPIEIQAQTSLDKDDVLEQIQFDREQERISQHNEDDQNKILENMRARQADSMKVLFEPYRPYAAPKLRPEKPTDSIRDDEDH